MQWRTGRFDFSSLSALRYSLETPTPIEGLTKALPAVDQQALENLSKDEDIVRLANSPARIELLWDTCALPDYRKIAPAQHADIIATIYQDLVRRGSVDEDYMSEQVRRADSTEGEIDTLSHRVAQIRTWTFVSHRPGWLADPTHWQEKTREIEDRLSDALHERLTKRFVDRRTSVLMRRLRENAMLEADISSTGDVIVEGHNVGQLEGFRFTADVPSDGPDAKAVKTAAQKALAAEFDRRAERFAAAPNGDFALGSDGVLRWVGATVATLVAGDDVLKPRAVILADEQLTGPARDKVAARIERFVAHHIETILKPLTDLSAADALTGMTRGLAFQIVESLGILQRRDVTEEVRGLDQDSRAALRRLGVRFGAYHVFMPMLLKPAPAGLITLLWALKNDGRERAGYGDVVNVLAAGRTSVVVDPAFDHQFYRLAGYRVLGRRAVRIDILERLADLIRPALAWRPGSGTRPEGAYDGGRFIVTPAMMSILGATTEDMEEILKSLGYRHEAAEAAAVTAKLAELDAFAAAAAQAEAVVEDTVFKPAVPAAAPASEAKPAVPAAEPVPAPVEAAAAAEVSGEEKPAVQLTEAPVEEPKPVLLWRQGRFEGRNNRNQDQNRQRHNRPQGGQGNEARKSEGGSEGGEGQNARDNRGGKRFDKNRRNHDGEGQNKREGFKGKPRDGNRDRQPKRDHGNNHQGNKRVEQERPVRIDPDSPFAKLLALKEQLKK
jgi:ATP-dependent RNA helicase SUPV3L1/SUV3